MATNFAWAAVYRLYDSGRVDFIPCGKLIETGYINEMQWVPKAMGQMALIEYIDEHFQESFSLTLSAGNLQITSTSWDGEAVESMATAMFNGRNSVYDIEEKKYITWS